MAQFTKRGHYPIEYEKLSAYVEDEKYKTDIKSRDHYICRCKYCLEHDDYDKPKLYILKDFTRGFCFHCEHVYLNPTKITEDEAIDEVTPIYRFKAYKSKTPGLDIPEFDASYYLESEPLNETAIQYLVDRNPFMDFNKYKLKCRPNKIVIPFFYEDDLVYYQVRYMKVFGNKYFNPVIKHKIPYILPGREKSNKCVLVEGVFDAIGADSLFDKSFMIIALLGKTVTEFQFDFLRQYGFEYIVVMLDKTELSSKIISLLKTDDEFKDIKYELVKSDGTDPEEYVRKFKETVDG